MTKNINQFLLVQIQKQLGHFLLDIDFEIPLTGVTAIFGRSGAGKTSLIQQISGLQTPDHGKILLGDQVLFDQQQNKNIAIEKRQVGYIFQDTRLFPHYTVYGNLCYGVRSKKDQAQQKYYQEIIDILGISHLQKRRPALLSGGEKQRVAIGRALLTRPKILLMDEPLAALDLPKKQELISYLKSLSKKINIPILYVTHSLDEILQLADYMIMLQNGRVCNQGPIDQVWSAPEMRPWLTNKEQSSLVIAKTAGLHPKYRLTKLLINNQPLWVNQSFPKEGHLVRIRIYAKDVSIALNASSDSSFRNILKTNITEIVLIHSKQRVEVKLTTGHTNIWANITLWAKESLGLTIGQTVYAQIKTLSITKDDLF